MINLDPQQFEQFKEAFIDKLHAEFARCGHCGKKDCAGILNSSKLPFHIRTLELLALLKNWRIKDGN